MKDGIYFNLSEEQYHAERRLSSSDIRLIIESPTDFWFKSNFNPLKKEPKSEAMKEGRILHTMILEGENFKNKYKVMPAEIEELNKNSNDFKIWKAAQSLEIVSYSRYKELNTLVQYLSQDGQILDNNIFNNGFPEVSILWTENDIKRKARIDYLREKSFIDLKTFIKNKKSNLDDYVKRYFFAYQVYIQMIYYTRALKMAKELNLPVYGNAEQFCFWERVKEEKQVSTIVFINREIPQSRVKVFTQEACADLWRLGEKQIEKAEHLYIENLELYGQKNAWLENIDTDNLILKDEDFPQSFYELLNGVDL